MKLFSYWRSTTSYRVRIALNLKGLTAEVISVDLVAGAQEDAAYVARNPIKGVPTLETDDGAVITQSMAILDYLDHIAPTPALLPADPLARAQVMAAALIFATDVHPVNNLKVVKRVKTCLPLMQPAQKTKRMRHDIETKLGHISQFSRNPVPAKQLALWRVQHR